MLYCESVANLFAVEGQRLRALRDSRAAGETISKMNRKEQDLHILYQDITSQHWSYSSERFAGGDNLLTAIARGWELDKQVTLRRHWFAGMRCIEIFHFTIRRDDVVADMAVVGNPYVYRYLASNTHDVEEADATVA